MVDESSMHFISEEGRDGNCDGCDDKYVKRIKIESSRDGADLCVECYNIMPVIECIGVLKESEIVSKFVVICVWVLSMLLISYNSN